jgi:hypothetical protein
MPGRRPLPPREKEKIKKHQANSKAHGAAFKPFVIERRGGWGMEAKMLAKLLAKEATINGQCKDHNLFYKRIVEEMSVSMHKGNFLMLHRGITDSRFHVARLTRNQNARIAGPLDVMPTAPFFKRIAWMRAADKSALSQRRYRCFVPAGNGHSGSHHY